MLFLLLLHNCLVWASDRSDTVKNWADNLYVEYKVVTNLESGSYFNYTVTFTNNGAEIHNKFPWCIYFNQDQSVKVPGTKDSIGRQGADIGQGLSIYHVNGNLWKMCTNENSDMSKWKPLPTGETRQWSLAGSRYINQDSTLFPRWFFACEERCPLSTECCTPTTIRSTENVTYNKADFVAPFDTRETYLRSKKDKFTPKSPSELYDDNEQKIFTNEHARYGWATLPQPSYVKATPGQNQIDADGNGIPEEGIPIHLKVWRYWFVTQQGCRNISQDLIDEQLYDGEDLHNSMNIYSGYNTKLDYDWELEVTSSVKLTTKSCEASEEALKVLKKLIRKIQSDPTSMLFMGVYKGNTARFGTRGMMLDVSRNYHGFENVMKLLEAMAELDMNQLHLRLTDDEGWRIEIDGLPELTTIGASRCFDPSQTSCLMPAYGSGPEKDSGAGSGFISRSEYMRLLKRADELNIRIVPEIVAPGHAGAAIAAVKDIYELIDPDQDDDSTSVQNYYDDTINPCMEGSYHFLTDVVRSFADMHRDYMHIHNHFHIGGDEVNTRYFKSSPICQKLVDSGEVESWDDLSLYFFRRYMKIVTDAADFNIDGWEEVWEYERTDENGDGIDLYAIRDPSTWSDYIRESTILTGYHWNNVWQDYDTSSTGYMMANAGYQVILAPATHIYLDMATDAEPTSRGLMWATRYSDLWKAFSLRPMHFQNNGLYNGNGDKLTTGCIDYQNGRDFECTKLEKPENIAGIQGCMWAEELIKPEFMWSQIFPRLAAIAERAYKEAEWESIYSSSSWDAVESDAFKDDFSTFRFALKHFHRYLEQQNIPYKLPQPGVKTQNETNNIYIYNEIMFRLEGTTEWKSEAEFTAEKGDLVEVATVSFDRQRWSQPQAVAWYDMHQCDDIGANDDYKSCEGLVNEAYLQCVTLCNSDSSCVASCNREYEQNLNKCPCKSGCPNGCPCAEYEC